MATASLAQALIDGYVENGFAASPEPGVMTRDDGEGHIELVGGSTPGELEVFVQGDHSGTVKYDSETFAEELHELVHEELGY